MLADLLVTKVLLFSPNSTNMSVSASDVSAVLSPIVAGAANLAKRLAAHKASLNAGAVPATDEGATMGPISPLDVSPDPENCFSKKYSILNVHFDT